MTSARRAGQSDFIGIKTYLSSGSAARGHNSGMVRRILGHTNARAFLARLKAAMTASGIDTALKFRHLFKWRTAARRENNPAGRSVQECRRRIHCASGGRFAGFRRAADDVEARHRRRVCVLHRFRPSRCRLSRTKVRTRPTPSPARRLSPTGSKMTRPSNPPVRPASKFPR